MLLKELEELQKRMDNVRLEIEKLKKEIDYDLEAVRKIKEELKTLDE